MQAAPEKFARFFQIRSEILICALLCQDERMPAKSATSASERCEDQDSPQSESTRVLVIMPVGLRRGGAELALRNLLKATGDSRIIWLAVFLEHGPMVQEIRDLGIESVVVPAGRLRQPARTIWAVLRLASLARRHQADLVLSWMTKGQIYGGMVSALSRRPGAWYQAGIPSPHSWLERVAALLPARVVLTCSGAGASVQRRLWPRRRVAVVYPGVSLDQFDPEVLPPPVEARRLLGLPAEGPLIGAIGRLQRWKGMHVLIEALPAIVKAHPDAQCVVVGEHHEREPDYLAYLEKLVDRLDLHEHVRLLVQRNSPMWIQAMDVVALVSDHEPFGIVVVEAMALGKPVVAGDTDGPTELIVDGHSGLLVPFGDSAALGQAVCSLVDDPKLAERIGAAARVRAEDFSMEAFASSFSVALASVVRPDAEG